MRAPQDEAFFLMPSIRYPHAEERPGDAEARLEARTAPMQRILAQPRSRNPPFRGKCRGGLRFAHPPYELRICPGAEFGGEGVARRVEVEPVGFDQWRGLDDDLVDVADQLEALVEVRAVKAEPIA